MWNSLIGEITFQSPTHVCLMTGGGIEWRLHISRITLMSLEGKTQGVRLFTYLQHKENEMLMFGFSEEEERTMFLNLISVNGVGVKAALRILSSFTPAQIQDILEKDDINTLSSIKGLGRKTAQKILLTLKGKIVWSVESTSDFYWVNDILESLIAMGFNKKEVNLTLKEVIKDLDLSDMDSSQREKQVFSQALFILRGC